MIVILNNRMEIVDGRSAGEESNLSSDRSGRRSLFKSAPKPNRPVRQRATILVTNERLTFRMDDLPRRPTPAATNESADQVMEVHDEQDSKVWLVFVRCSLHADDRLLKNIVKAHRFPEFGGSETDVDYMP